MRILHVIPQFPYFGGRTIIGGHASCLLTLSSKQAQLGNDVLIISHIQQFESIQIEPGLTARSVLRGIVPGSVRFGLCFWHAASRWASNHATEFDLVHCHSGFADYLIVASRLKAILDLPVLHTLYCPIPLSGGRWRLPIVRGILRDAAQKLDGLSAISRNVAQSMREFGIAEVQTIPPAVDIDRFSPSKDALLIREKLGLRPDDVAVLFVGNAKSQKNLRTLLRAIQRVRQSHPNARLIITTELKQSSSDAELAYVHNMLADLGLLDSTVQLGIIDDMPGLMRASDMLVAPFLNSIGPSDYFMAALEAMACGRPAIVSAVGAMPEIMTDDIGRMFDPLDVDELTLRISELVADEGLRNRLGLNARARIEGIFAPLKVAGQYSSWYSEFAVE